MCSVTSVRPADRESQARVQEISPPGYLVLEGQSGWFHHVADVYTAGGGEQM